jgi:hypothetical protein
LKPGLSVAIAVGFGYLLGRRRKMRTALLLCGAAAVGRFSRDPGQLLARGTKALGVSPQLNEVADLSGPLIEAGKAAARAAVNNGIDTVSERLRDRSEALRRPLGKAPETEGREPEREAAPREEHEEEYEAYEEGRYEEEPEEPEERAPAPVRRRSQEGTQRRPRRQPLEDLEEDEAPPRGSRTRTGAPVRRGER